MKNWQILLIALLAIFIGFFSRDFLQKAPPSPTDKTTASPNMDKPQPIQETKAESVPLCTTPDIQSRLQDTLKKNDPNFEILELYPNYEIFYDEEKKSRECIAGLATSSGEIAVWYNFRENRSTKGEYLFIVKQVNFDPNLLIPVPLNDEQLKMLQGKWIRRDMILNIGKDYTKIDSVENQKPSTVCRNIKYDTALTLGYCHVNGAYKELDKMCSDRSCPAIDTVKLKKRSDGLRFMLPGVWEESWDDEDKEEDSELIFKKEAMNKEQENLSKEAPLPNKIVIEDFEQKSGFLSSNVEALKSIEVNEINNKVSLKNGQEVIIDGKSTDGNLYRAKLRADSNTYYYLPVSSVALFSE